MPEEDEEREETDEPIRLEDLGLSRVERPRREISNADVGKIIKEKNPLIQEAIAHGIHRLKESHPRFKQSSGFFEKHVNLTGLRGIVRDRITRCITRGDSEEDTDEFLKQTVIDYVSSGEVLDEKAKELILRQGILDPEKQKGFARGLKNRARDLVNKVREAPGINLIPKVGRREDGVEYLDRSIEAFSSLYDLMESGDYGERMPEVKEDVKTLYKLGFWDAAVDILRQGDLINESNYRTLKKQIYSSAKKSQKRFSTKMYESIKEAEVVILALTGIFLVAVSGIGINGITGNAINSGVGKIAPGIGILWSLVCLAASYLIMNRKD